MEDNPLVSVVVGVRNMENTINSCIESLLALNYPNLEIIIVNDGSDDKTAEIVKQYPVKLFTTEKKGISHARNFGFQKSSGMFIAYTDADCTVTTDWISSMIKHFDDDKVALVGGVTYYQTDGSVSSIYRQIDFEKRYNRIVEKEVNWAGGMNCIFRRKVLEEVGGFNPKWVHGEDAEISFLIRRKGYKIIKENDAIVYHIPEKGFKLLIKKAYRDGAAYVRATLHHFSYSIRNKFNVTWYFPYDMVLQPVFYALLLVGIPIILILPIFLNHFVITLLFWIEIGILLFLFIYAILPAYDVSKRTPKKKSKISYFIKSLCLHILRGFAWGIGLYIGVFRTIKLKITS